MSLTSPIVVGFTGHQDLSPATRTLIRACVRAELDKLAPVVGVTSLAAGSDQMFAECVVDMGGELRVIVPCDGYENSFTSTDDLAKYRRLLAAATLITVLDHPIPSETAFWDAGKKVVDQADVVFAVWDGRPAAGLGGTGDVVKYATDQRCDVVVVWPATARRGK